MTALETAITNATRHLLDLRVAQGYWEGQLASSALSTATAIVALMMVDAENHDEVIRAGVDWLLQHQNADGGFGDTTTNKSNLSTTLLGWSALHLAMRKRLSLCGETLVSQPVTQALGPALARAGQWVQQKVGSLEPEAIQRSVVARYGKDKTFSVPILMLCAICGTLGKNDSAWRRVLPLPFELAALPRNWFGAIGLPVVSYALPALISIGYARHHHAPFSWLNPLRWVKVALWPLISPMLKTLQPSTGGYLEATPLTSFVTMALASAGQKQHPCVSQAVKFLLASQRADGSWPIDTNLSTWGTTLAIKALEGHFAAREQVKTWLLNQQYREVHPFTNAAPGAWAWTDLPGGVPDADDTPGAMIALHWLADDEADRRSMVPAMEAAVEWLLNLQNRDGGMPTFCRGWGTLPFDRSTPELTSHALWAWRLWKPELNDHLKQRLDEAEKKAWQYLQRQQRSDGSWVPLWFGNEHAPEEENPVHGTAMVLRGTTDDADFPLAAEIRLRGIQYLLKAQGQDGGWGGAMAIQPSIEETANAITALASFNRKVQDGDLHAEIQHALHRGVEWLIQNTDMGTRFKPSPIGLYFARLWYHEKLYPVVWALGAFKAAQRQMLKGDHDSSQT